MRNEEQYHETLELEELCPLPYCDSCRHSVLMTADMLYCDCHKRLIFAPWGCEQFEQFTTNHKTTTK